MKNRFLDKRQSYQICTRCVMDTTAVDIHFDESGVCNYCKEFLDRSGEMLSEESSKKKLRLDERVEEVRKQGKGKPYDCIVGISGGVDSSWALVKVVELGLRPLAVHMDNGWNSELAQNNIANLINGLDVDLYTHVIDWDEYRDLMQAFFDANVIDVELLYDNAMLAVNYQMAVKQNLKHILAGTNQSTEGMQIPPNWNWYKKDKKNIKSIVAQFGGVRLETFPSIGTIRYLWNEKVRNIRWVSFLDYIDYQKENAIQHLEANYGYKRYPYKHYESVFTRFYQGYILPEKFGVDKRRLHLSNLIITDQIKREEAVEALRKIPYTSDRELEDDKNYFLKKMKWSEEELNTYLNRENKSHDSYGTELPFIMGLSNLNKKLKGIIR